MGNGTFEPGTKPADERPDYPHVAMRIPKGKAVIGSATEGNRREGVRKGEVCFVPVDPEDIHAAYVHVQFLKNKKKYGYVSCEFFGKLKPKDEAALRHLVGGWEDLKEHRQEEVRRGRKSVGEAQSGA